MSLANIENFLEKGIKFNGARPSRFLCSVTLPTGLSGAGGLNLANAGQKFIFACKAASIPSFEVGVVNVPYFGRVLKYSGDRTWNDWDVSVLLDADYSVRKLFELWSNQINKLEDNTMDSKFSPNSTGSTSTSVNNYKGSIDIYHYGQQDDDNNPIAQYKLIGAWPSSIGPLQLAWAQTNAISEFSVRFAYDSLTPSDTNIYDPGALQTSTLQNTQTFTN